MLSYDSERADRLFEELPAVITEAQHVTCNQKPSARSHFGDLLMLLPTDLVILLSVCEACHN